MQDAKEEVRARLAIEDIIGEYVELKRAGRNFKGLSPFNDERTPSFVVSPDKHIWHDFSSGKGGDVFSFVMAMDGIDFKEALEKLARKAGVDLSLYQSAQQGKLGKQKARLRQALDIVARVFQRELLSHSPARQYAVEARGLGRNVIRDFCIGYAPPGRDGLVQLLRRRGFSQQELVQAGLVNQYGGDLFRDRLMVPLMDASGRVIGFTGRLIHDDIKAPKYLNTPATLLYDKSRHVFGLSQAKTAIREEGFAVIVEGNMDVVSSHQAGVRTAVATAGTAMTEHHIRAIARLSGDIRLAYDSDEAGLAATERAIVLAQTVGVELRVVELPAGVKDPDELIQKDIELWRKSIASPQPAMEWIFDQYQKRLDISTAKGKKDFSTIALKLVENLNDPVEKDFYINEISKRIGVSKATLLNKIGEEKKPEKTKKRVKIEKTDKKFVDDFLYEDDLLALAIKEPRLAKMLSDLKENSLHGEQRNKILEILKSEDMELLKSFDEYVKILLLKADERLGNIKESATDEMKRLIQKVKTENLRTQKENLQAELENAEIQGDENLKTKILSKIIELNKELNSGKR